MSYTSSNPISLETLQNNVKMANILGYAFMGIVLIGIGAAASTQGGVGIAFAIFLVGAGLYLIYNYSYKELIDPRNERKCDIRNLDRIANVLIPDSYLSGDADIDTMIDSYETDILMKVIYGNYGGVYLQSNVEGQGGTYDAWLIPAGTKKTVTSQTISDATLADLTTANRKKYANRLYLVKKGDKKVTAVYGSPDASGRRSNVPVPNQSDPKSPFWSECDPTYTE